ncbi:MAG: type II secretion system protein GspD [Myxococcales bacterium]|nr:type II secretion system protein GspD [Myxococcales bacterium]
MNGLKPLLVMLALSSPLVLSTTAQAQSSKRKGSRGKPVDCFKEQTYKLPKLLQLMSELTRKNFILNEKLKNKEVTIYCERSVSVNEMYRVFISALAIHKLTIVRVGKFYRVTAMKDAKGAPSPTYLGSTEGMPYDERLVTLIHKLKHMDASVIQKVIKSMVGKNGKLEVLPPRLIVLSDNALNIRRLLKVIEHLDTEGGSQRIHFYEARYAEAQSLAAKLKEVFEVEGKNKSKKKSGSKKKAKGGETSPDEVVLDRVVADERTNQLIIVAPEAAFKRAKDLLDKLDVPTPDDEGAIHVIRLENATAKDLAGTLSGLITGVTSNRKSKSKKKSSSGGRATSDPEGLFQGDVKVSADEPTNSLVVVASRNDLRVLKNIVEKLDYRRPQVFVEAAFLELTINDNSQIGAGMHTGVTTQGTDWEDGDFEFLKDGGGVVNMNTGLNSLTSGLGQIASQGLVGTFQGMPIPGLDAILPDNMTLPTFGIVLQALQGNGAVDVLSTPHLLTTDNEEAEIVVGENVPFASGLSGGLGGLSNLLGGAANSGTASAASSALSGLGGLGIPSVSIQRQDVALKFKLTPHITNTGHVRMELEVEISELGEIEPTTRSPRTTQRKLKTTVLAMDNQTIVIGGLISDKQTESENRIPILSRIPLLGHLFKNRETKTAKTNLLMVLTPHVVRDQQDFARIHREKMQERKALASLAKRRHSSLPPSVNWRRKIGAFARIERVLQDQESRIENGGKGDGSDAVITPEKAAEEKPAVEGESEEESSPKEGEAPDAAKADEPSKDGEAPKGTEDQKPADKGAK